MARRGFLAELQHQSVATIDDAIAQNDYRTANMRSGYVYVISNRGAFGYNIVRSVGRAASTHSTAFANSVTPRFPFRSMCTLCSSLRMLSPSNANSIASSPPAAHNGDGHARNRRTTRPLEPAISETTVRS